MELIRRIEEMIAPTLAEMGYAVVRVRLSGGTRPTLQIMAERSDETGMTVEDCAAISHSVSAILDVDDPISGGYTLEVSSPGIDRPLVRRRDFERFAGFEAKIEMQAAVGGRRRFRGRLDGIDGDLIRLSMTDGIVRLPLADIEQAKLVLTDDLLTAAETAG